MLASDPPLYPTSLTDARSLLVADLTLRIASIRQADGELRDRVISDVLLVRQQAVKHQNPGLPLNESVPLFRLYDIKFGSIARLIDVDYRLLVFTKVLAEIDQVGTGILFGFVYESLPLF